MSETWLQYERKRNAFEKKWKQRIEKELNKPLYAYIESYKAGTPSLNVFSATTLSGVLLRMYADVGKHFAKEQYRELRQISKVGIGRNSTQRDGKNWEQAYQLKRGALGFSIDWANRVIEKLRLSALNLAQKISNFTRQKVLDILEQAQTDNLSLDETVKRLISEVEGMNASRAEAITRTEVGRAAGIGKREGAKALGVQLRKKWVSARDHRTRVNPKRDPKKGDHWVLNGQVRDFNEPYSNGVHQLMQPGDPNAPASETVRCRCTETYEVVTDEQGKPIQQTYFDRPDTGQLIGGVALGSVIQEAVNA